MRILKLGETINLCGLSCSVVQHSSYDYFYLSNIIGHNSRIFDGIAINKLELQEKTIGYSKSGGFPYCTSLEDLTKFAIAISEEYDKRRSEPGPSLTKLDYTIDLSSEKIKNEGRLKTFLLLNI